MARHRPKNQAAAAPEGPRAAEPWDHIPRSGDDWVMPGLYTRPDRPWKGYFTYKRTRNADMSDKHWENWQYTGCYQNEFMGLYLFMFQDLATRRLYPRRCVRGPCRRMGKCAGRKPQDGHYRYDIDPCVPPCVPDDYDTIEGMRKELLEEYYAYGRKAGAPWAFRPGDANYGDSNRDANYGDSNRISYPCDRQKVASSPISTHPAATQPSVPAFQRRRINLQPRAGLRQAPGEAGPAPAKPQFPLVRGGAGDRQVSPPDLPRLRRQEDRDAVADRESQPGAL